MMPRPARVVAALAATCLVAGCMSGGQVDMHHASTARPTAAAFPAMPTGGAIFAGSGFYRPLFEDRRPRMVGDTVVININESLSASQSSASSAQRNTSMGMSVPIIQGLLGKSFQGASVSGSDDNKLDSKGATSNVNVFTGTITATVIEVLSNGNLVVAGERQIGINHNAEFVRFSGVVTPASIQVGNQVSSTQVADVRLEYVGRGYIDSAQAMPWLQRFFMSVAPF